MIDSHCHLADEVYAADLEGVIARAHEAGVHSALVILAAGDAQEEARAARVHALWPDARVSIGVHPHQARDFAENPDGAGDTVRAQVARTPYARAIGEIGLDYHYDFSPRDVQHAVFRSQLRTARALDLPVVVHTREADEDTIAIMQEEGGGNLRGVLHCFTGGPALADAGLALGLYISVAGILTFPKAGDLRETIRAVPINRLLIETDSPFLAPVPHRGKRNEPAWVARVLDTLADLHGIETSAMAQRTSANFRALFTP